jgi:hypothetical protein
MHPKQAVGRCAFVLAFFLASFTAAAQQAYPNAQVTWSFHETGPNGWEETTSGTCTGIPTCNGTYTTVFRGENCTNHLSFTGQAVFTNVVVGSNTVTGVLTFTPGFYDFNRQANGTCSLTNPTPPEVVPFTLSWNPATGTGTGVVGDFGGIVTFKADLGAPPPTFPMVVHADITPVTATASADIQFRPQDVGQSGGVFVFASAPATQVQGGLLAKAVHLGTAAKADTPCVLAQASPTGQLVAVTASQLQAAVTGAFSAQGTSVAILNSVPTPSVAGATFYVGYGANSAAMLNDGIFRNAVLVPGNATCPPLPYMTSLWWNPSESGWGLNLNQQGSTLFATLFTYDASRAPMWLVMSGGTLQADGVSFTGDLYRTTGPAFNANPFIPIGAANVTRVGTMTVSFGHANAGVLSYTVNGVSVTKNIQRQVYGSRSANCLPTTASRSGSTQYQDLWWNAAESGWGLNVTHQDNTLFATLFTYDPSGRDLWLVMSAGARQSDGSYLGDLYRTAGSAFSTNPFPPIGASDVTNVGNMRLRFTNGESGTLTYTYNGTTVTKAITRQVFSTPLSACN